MYHILVVDDSPTQAERLRGILEDDGHEVLVAGDGAAALDILAHTHVDLVISDIIMPGMTGYELCHQIKARFREKNFPVMLLSQLNEPMDIIRGLESGADNFLTKPYGAEQIVPRVRQILVNRSLRSETRVLGTSIMFLGKRFTITSEKEQILDLLISTFEDTVRTNRELQRHKSELAEAKARLEDYATGLEGRVRLSEEKYGLLMENANSAILVVSPEGLILEANRETAAILGQGLEEIVGKRIDAFVHPAPPETFADHWERVIADGMTRISSVAIVRPDGSRIWIDVAASLVLVGDTNLVHVIWHDITERMRLEYQLKHAHRMRYALLAENTREHLLFIDRDTHRIIEANTAALDAYGYTAEEITGLSLEDLRASETHELLDDLFARADNGVLVDLEAVRKDGTLFPVETALRSGELDGRRVVLDVGRDITERRNTMRQLSSALEESVTAAQLKSQFVATVSHEIRTPLNGVIGMSELLLRTKLSEEQRDQAETVHESSIALLRIINDILDFSKLEAGRAELETIDFDMSNLVEGVVELMNRAIKRESVTLITYVSPDVPHVLRGDPGRLRQILMNLVGNAIKFTETGHVLVSVDVVQQTDERVHVSFAVADTGIGMTAEARARLFQPFSQGDASTTRRFGGTGLGLVICKAYVELMGGTISVDSTPNVGTSVTFTVDLEYAKGVEAPPELGTIAGLRLLVVDDDPTTRRILQRYASDWEMHSESASDIADALDKLRAASAAGQPFDIAMIDYVLPGGNGLELGSEIKRDPLLCATRLMMVTAYDIEGREETAEAYGFEAYLRKPIVQSNVYDGLVTMLTNKSQAPAGVIEPMKDDIPRFERRLRVLLAEDNAVNRRVAERQLTMLGCEFAVAENGEAAVAAVLREPFDVVLMDCNMPVMDGFEATRQIRFSEESGGRPRVPVIAMTANAAEEDRQRCLAVGMDDYISKPILIDALHTTLQRVVLERSSALRI